MKSAKLHSQADSFLLGYSVPIVHTVIDAAVKTLGPQHRQINHIYPVVEGMGIAFGKKGKMCSLLHLFLDMNIIDSKYIEEQIKTEKHVVKTKRGGR